jgi:hypothetical protein
LTAPPAYNFSATSVNRKQLLRATFAKADIAGNEIAHPIHQTPTVHTKSTKASTRNNIHIAKELFASGIEYD